MMNITLPEKTITMAYTQTLKPTAFKLKATEQLKTTFPLIKALVKETCAKACIYVELTKTGNVHYHGTLTFFSDRHKFQFLDSTTIRQKLGFYMLKDIDNQSRWDDYCMKNLIETQRFLNCHTKDVVWNYVTDVGLRHWYVERTHETEKLAVPINKFGGFVPIENDPLYNGFDGH